eukprot:CAMPEP_0194753440 /NCGR_PEP_ID=MMETSP0323_2-20130528/7380_1 /TAXON_ID=2866 ORGANISM="Crypthecodinium cohnii, Strain Seligo" /NCGR_SAMPLE_ID=MMETSP0323_2 /ASSEMBLY_ACC=CAM_ASM_000346 /LENGTH=71 /DNA_ID=CAMNT_0039671283 /DNA_START=278 /DNA_END=489 /DNA_ORIENTATION=-
MRTRHSSQQHHGPLDALSRIIQLTDRPRRPETWGQRSENDESASSQGTTNKKSGKTNNKQTTKQNKEREEV